MFIKKVKKLYRIRIKVDFTQKFLFKITAVKNFFQKLFDTLQSILIKQKNTCIQICNFCQTLDIVFIN
jgi:hypothetical protein